MSTTLTKTLNLTRLADARYAVDELGNHNLRYWLDNTRHPNGHLMGDDPGLVQAFADIGSALRRRGPAPGTVKWFNTKLGD